ncbi:MAG TPA: hypothetical protein VLE43_19765 [Candidatus Saccharimonadia bacterium]|nr:hypothetical protein [Candidatus Saccharimonadia bacterium]
MFPSKSRLAVLTLLTAAGPLVAQVHEADEPADLTKGLALKADTAKSNVPLAEAVQTQVGAKDFAFSFTVLTPLPTRDAILASQGDDSQGWRLLLTAERALRFEARTKGKPDPITVATPPGIAAPGHRHHIALNILRDAAKPNAGIWLDGIELASGIMPPVDLNATQPLSSTVEASHVRVYQRSLSRPEMLALWLEASGAGKPAARHPSPPSGGPRFIPRQDETIALIGGTEAVALAESGDLEAMLLLAFPQSHLRFRNLAWEGDTVFKQDRPMSFGDLAQQLRRVNAGSVFMMFGRQECLDRGKDGLQEFKVWFGKLLDVVQKQTQNIVIVGPQPFEVLQAPLPDLSKKNVDLLTYEKVMKAASDERGLIFVPMPMPNHSDNVRDLFEHDHALTSFQSNPTLVAEVITMDLALPIFNAFTEKPTNPFSSQPNPYVVALNGVRPLLNAKNRLWHNYWRPSNWAFLHGDRTQQPSSRDPVNPQLRFFPAEQEKYLPLLKEAEEKVYKLVDETTKKLP